MSARGNLKANLQLFVTRRCQLRCIYCPILKGDGIMALSTALKGADLLLGHGSPRLRLDFGGGEPLMNFDVVREVSAYAARRAAELDKRMGFYMVTNAVLVDDEVLEWAGRNRVLLEFSMDGAPPDHNRYKAAYDRGLDPYKATRAGVERARRAGAPHFVIMVASPANVGRLAENFEHLLDIGVRSVDLSYAIGAIWSPEDEALFFAQVERVLDRHARALDSGEIRLGNASQRVEPTILNSELMVDTDGSLHQMTEWMFETTPASAPAPFPVGTLDSVKDINALRWSRFHAYYTLVKMYEGNAKVQAALLNNISFGLRVGKFFRAAAGRLGKVAA
ncbi:MAG: radical SAM protein [Elusimicrobia bacterium]|nr:radical SAM protein [Elusimicrobiota bacterium]